MRQFIFYLALLSFFCVMFDSASTILVFSTGLPGIRETNPLGYPNCLLLNIVFFIVVLAAYKASKLKNGLVILVVTCLMAPTLILAVFQSLNAAVGNVVLWQRLTA